MPGIEIAKRPNCRAVNDYVLEELQRMRPDTLILHANWRRYEELELWQSSPPSAQALASTQPFAVDTLNFDQWLQWILLPRMNELLVLQLPLPAKSAIAAMAEEVYEASDPGAVRIITLIADIDLLLREDGGQPN